MNLHDAADSDGRAGIESWEAGKRLAIERRECRDAVARQRDVAAVIAAGPGLGDGRRKLDEAAVVVGWFGHLMSRHGRGVDPKNRGRGKKGRFWSRAA
jgi:hypothetical protein